jgi:sortase A
VPVVFNPLVAADGSVITPVNRDFSLVIPAIGVNARVLPNVDPTHYTQALLQGVAHASTSFLPDGNGTVYLFSHSTNYDWYVRDLNAIFYLLKNLKEGDLIVIIYKDKEYTYRLRETRVVAPTEVSYLIPRTDKKSLILQTCWPPGSTSQRLLLFADHLTI